MSIKKFVELDHKADVKFKITGKSLENIFENVTLAFSSYIFSKRKIKEDKKISITLTADNKETLLYKFIDELIFLLDTKYFAVISSKVKLNYNNTILKAKLSGVSTKNIKLVHVKAATYSEMYIKNIKNSWESQIVLDV